jgi:hypothetical protein
VPDRCVHISFYLDCTESLGSLMRWLVRSTAKQTASPSSLGGVEDRFGSISVFFAKFRTIAKERVTNSCHNRLLYLRQSP